MAVVIQPGTGKEIQVADSSVEFWAERGYQKKAEAKKVPVKKPAGK